MDAASKFKLLAVTFVATWAMTNPVYGGDDTPPASDTKQTAKVECCSDAAHCCSEKGTCATDNAASKDCPACTQVNTSTAKTCTEKTCTEKTCTDAACTASACTASTSDTCLACPRSACPSTTCSDAVATVSVTTAVTENDAPACCSQSSTSCSTCPACNTADHKVTVKVTEASDSPAMGFGSFVSNWLATTPKFSAEFAIHFGSDNPRSKLGSGVPVVDVPSTTSAPAERSPQIARPMKFVERIPRIQLGELVGDVIVCGHRICSGNKCYDVKDEPVAGTHCDTTEGSAATDAQEEEPILVVPMAPPAPPGLEVAEAIGIEMESDAEAFLGSIGLENVNATVPVVRVVELLVSNTELHTRLEMTEQLMNERLASLERVQALAERNSQLSAQLAASEARQHANELLTTSLIERAEMAIKLASLENKGPTTQDATPKFSMQTIQEDLSNIRKQIAILRRAQPVGFAPSYLGSQPPRPYIPTAQLYSKQSADESGIECGTESETPVETTVK